MVTKLAPSPTPLATPKPAYDKLDAHLDAPMTPLERVSYGVTGVTFASSTLYAVHQGFTRALDANMIGDPHLPLNGYAIAMALVMGAGVGLVTGVELLRCAIVPMRRNGEPL